MKTVPCPACQRPNAPHRPRCMYCGTEMPAVAVPSEPRALPENLDALIRAAMSGQGTADLKTALLQVSDEMPAASPAVIEAVAEPAELIDLDTSSLQPLELVPEALDALDAPVVPRMMPFSAISTEESTIDDGLAQLERMLAEARQAWKASDVHACRSSLGLLQAQLPSLISQPLRGTGELVISRPSVRAGGGLPCGRREGSACCARSGDRRGHCANAGGLSAPKGRAAQLRCRFSPEAAHSLCGLIGARCGGGSSGVSARHWAS